MSLREQLLASVSLALSLSAWSKPNHLTEQFQTEPPHSADPNRTTSKCGYSAGFCLGCDFLLHLVHPGHMTHAALREPMRHINLCLTHRVSISVRTLTTVSRTSVLMDGTPSDFLLQTLTHSQEERGGDTAMSLIGLRTAQVQFVTLYGQEGGA